MIKQKLLDQVRSLIRMRHLSYSTEKSYLYCIRSFIPVHNKRHPAKMGVTVLMMDGIRLSKEQLAVAAVGITAGGSKHVLDFELGNSLSKKDPMFLNRILKIGIQTEPREDDPTCHNFSAIVSAKIPMKWEIRLFCDKTKNSLSTPPQIRLVTKLFNCLKPTSKVV